MKTVGIIAEYNPFHNGHAWQIREVRQRTGADLVVAVMSGDFVQRGEPAFLNQHIRAKMALLGGADLVLELPLPFSCSSAEAFAAAGVHILNNLGCVDALVFGIEPEALPVYRAAAELIAEESSAWRNRLLTGLKTGLSYPAARMQALRETLPSDSFSAAELGTLASPNAILALEYDKALRRSGSSLTPVPIPRIGSDYYDRRLTHAIPSATALRERLLSYRYAELPEAQADLVTSPTNYRESADANHPSVSFNETAVLPEYLPESCWAELRHSWRHCGPVTADDLSLPLHWRLLSFSSPEEIRGFLDISPSLSNRIFNLRNQFTTFEEFAELLKTKNMTLTHVRRSLLHLALEIRQIPPANPMDHTGSELPAYTRILGMKKTAAPLLHQIKQSTAIPVLTKPADAKSVIKNFPAYTPAQKHLALEQFQCSCNGANQYQALLTSLYSEPFHPEITRTPAIL